MHGPYEPVIIGDGHQENPETLAVIAKAIGEGYRPGMRPPGPDVPKKSRAARKAAKQAARRIRKLRA